jgi:DNA damage-binding protein 1
VDLGFDNPRIITHGRALHSFGVACVRTSPTRVGEAPILVRSTVKLLDDVTLDVQDNFSLADGYEITSLEILTLSTPNGSRMVLCIGAVAEGVEPTEGICLVLAVGESLISGRRLELLVQAEVKGCIYAFAEINGALAVAKDSSVCSFLLPVMTGTVAQIPNPGYPS